MKKWTPLFVAMFCLGLALGACIESEEPEQATPTCADQDAAAPAQACAFKDLALCSDSGSD